MVCVDCDKSLVQPIRTPKGYVYKTEGHYVYSGANYCTECWDKKLRKDDYGSIPNMEH